MKVIHLISGGDSGGAKTHVHSLLQNLSRTIDVTMVCFMEGPFAQEARELGIRTVVLPGRNLLRTYRTLKRMIREGGYQIIHCHGARGNMMGALLRRATGLPVVTTVHSDYRLDYLGRPFSRLTYGTINTIALRLLDYRIGVSDAMTDLLISRGFDPDKLFTIYNGIDFTPRTPAMAREAVLESVGLQADEDSVVVGIAARLNPVKDIATLVRGFALAHADLPQAAAAHRRRRRADGHAEKPGPPSWGWRSRCALPAGSPTPTASTTPSTSTPSPPCPRPSPTPSPRGPGPACPRWPAGWAACPTSSSTASTACSSRRGTPRPWPATWSPWPRTRTLRSHMGQRLYQRAKEDYSLESTLQRQLDIYRTILRRQERKNLGRRDGALVCGAYGRGNAGDDAILEAIVTELRQIDPDLPVWVLSRNPETPGSPTGSTPSTPSPSPGSCGGCARPGSTSTAAAP